MRCPARDRHRREGLPAELRSAVIRPAGASVLVEQTFTTERAARTELLGDPMHVYAYLDGVALHDPEGVLAGLRATAQQVFSAYRMPHACKIALADAFAHPEEKARTAAEAGDLLKATFALATSSWQIIEGLWAANDLPLPPNSSVRPHLRDLAGPPDVEARFADLFVGEPVARVEAGLFLLSWIRTRLAEPT